MVQRYKVPFVLASTAHGPVILGATEWQRLTDTHVEFGVGVDLLVNGEYDMALVSMTVGALEARHRSHGPGVVALDCGASVGIYSMEWARAMEGWGQVIAFEPQERMYYALAGNLAINNLFNVKALNKAVGAKPTIADMPVPDYHVPRHYGRISLKPGVGAGQDLPTAPVEVVSIDSLGINRVDFIKFDIEGMELEALEGAKRTIERNRPFVLVEHHISGREKIEFFLKMYQLDTAVIGPNMLAGPSGGVMDRFHMVSAETEKLSVGLV